MIQRLFRKACKTVGGYLLRKANVVFPGIKPVDPLEWGKWEPSVRTWNGRKKADVIRWIKDNGKKQGKKITWGSAKEVYRAIMEEDMFQNNLYVVSIRKETFKDELLYPGMWHLTVKRLDGLMARWEDLQRIKNELCHPDAEAVEIYPRQSRAISTQNESHLWVFMSKGNDGKFLLLDFGYRGGLE